MRHKTTCCSHSAFGPNDSASNVLTEVGPRGERPTSEPAKTDRSDRLGLRTRSDGREEFDERSSARAQRADTQRVLIADAWGRDGLQTLVHCPDLHHPTTSEKAEVILMTDRAGVPEIEITGFVHPRVIPSLSDAAEVAQLVLSGKPQAKIRVLVPNTIGMQRAIDAGIQHLKLLIVASETYQRLNSNMSIGQNLRQILGIATAAEKEDVHVSVGIGTAFVCPYEGVIPTDSVSDLVAKLSDVGVSQITLADSVGLAWPSLVRDRFHTLADDFPHLELGLHMHDLAGLGLSCVLAAFEAGVRRFDGVVGGLGGGIAMPVSTLLMPNVATEDLVYMFEAEGVTTGVDQDAISAVGLHVQELMGAGSAHLAHVGSRETFQHRALAHLSGLGTRPGDSSAQ